MRRIITIRDTPEELEARALRHQEVLKKQELEKQKSIVRAKKLKDKKAKQRKRTENKTISNSTSKKLSQKQIRRIKSKINKAKSPDGQTQKEAFQKIDDRTYDKQIPNTRHWKGRHST